MSETSDPSGPASPHYLLQERRAGQWHEVGRYGSVDAALRHLTQVTANYQGQRLRLLDGQIDAATGQLAYTEALSIDPGDPSPASLPSAEDIVAARRRHRPAPTPDEADAETLVAGLRQGDQWRESAWRRLVAVGRRAGPEGPAAASRPALAATLGALLVVSFGVGGGAVWLAENPSGVPAFPLLARPLVARDAPPPGVEADVMFGHSWERRLTEVKAEGASCRRFDRGLIGCEVAAPVWPSDAMTVQLLFDEASERLTAIQVVSEPLTDTTDAKDGTLVRQRFDQIKRTIEETLPAGSAALTVINSPKGQPFWEGLRADTGAGAFYASWPSHAALESPGVTLKLYGLDRDRGFYKLLVEPPGGS